VGYWSFPLQVVDGGVQGCDLDLVAGAADVYCLRSCVFGLVA